MVSGPLPKWKSHKEVHGDKVVEVYQSPVHDRVDGTDSGWRWKLKGGEVVNLNLDMVARLPFGNLSKDPVGGYYVLYPDGYESWSPAKAFEEGYVPID